MHTEGHSRDVMVGSTFKKLKERLATEEAKTMQMLERGGKRYVLVPK